VRVFRLMGYRRKASSRRTLRPLGALLACVLCGAAYGKITTGVENWGLGGSVKSGLWTPLYLEFKSSDADFDGFLEAVVDADQQTKPVFIQRVSLVKDTPGRFWIYVRTPPTYFRIGGWRFSWRLIDDRQEVVAKNTWRSPVVLKSCESLVAVMTTANAGNAHIGAITDQQSSAPVHVRYVPPSMAPNRWVGYQSADALIWMNPEPDKLDLVAQQEAVVKYVRNGGHLVLAAGADWQPMVKSFLKDLLPADVVGSETVNLLSELSEFGTGDVTDGNAVTLVLRNPRGDVLMSRGNRPVIVRGSAGLGRVTLIGFDPTKAPFSELADLRAFWAGILQTRLVEKEDGAGGQMEFASNALVLALNDFPDFKPINFFFVGTFLFVYVLLIGPVDYFVLKRLKKLHWTWVTFPSIAVASSLIAFLMLSSGRVAGFHANSVSIVDASAESDQIGGTTLLTMLSPRQREYNVRLENAIGSIAPREFQVLGLGASPLGSTPCYVASPGGVIERMLVRVWDAQTLTAQWAAIAPELPEVAIEGAGSRLTGTVKNNTPYELRNACLIYRDSVVPLGRIAPNGSAELSAHKPRKLLDYVREVTPARFMAHQFFRGMGGGRLSREKADDAARWLSLFAYAHLRKAPGTKSEEITDEQPPAQGLFARFLRTRSEFDARMDIAFDLPASVQLPDLSSGREAILLFWVHTPFVRITVSGMEPDWNRSLVRMRIPIAGGRSLARGD